MQGKFYSLGWAFLPSLMGLASGSIDSTISRPYPSAMNLERIRNRVSGGGFRPFALRTSDGREYPVRHHECVLVGPRSLAVLDREGEIVTLDPLHIVVINDLRAKANGRRSAR